MCEGRLRSGSPSLIASQRTSGRIGNRDDWWTLCTNKVSSCSEIEADRRRPRSRDRWLFRICSRIRGATEATVRSSAISFIRPPIQVRLHHTLEVRSIARKYCRYLGIGWIASAAVSAQEPDANWYSAILIGPIRGSLSPVHGSRKRSADP